MKQPNSRPVTLLLVEDDPDDCLLVREALAKSRLNSELRCLQDGEELLEYLRRLGKFADPKQSPRPGLILLDLNLPRKDGREALREIKNDPQLRAIPIVALTTSKSEEDVARAYNLGVNSYITKPVRFSALVEVMETLGKYWFEIVELPGNPQPNSHG